MIEVSKLSKKDLEEYLSFLKKQKTPEEYKLPNIPTNYTFGIEIEFAKAFLYQIEDMIKIYNQTNYMDTWKVVTDSTVTKEGNIGGEVVSPKLKNNYDTFEQIKNICSMLKENNAIIDESCSGHIHVGAHIFKTSTQLLNFLKIWLLYEPIIYQFSTGEFTKIRKGASSFAKPLRSKLNLNTIINLENKSMIDCIRKIHPLYLQYGENVSKTSCLNIMNIKSDYEEEKNTIEIRCPNGTLNPFIWQNNINFFLKLIKASINCDPSFIAYKLNKLSEFNNYLNDDDLFELVDLIFVCDQEKTNFLKQYFKLPSNEYTKLK